MSPAVLHVVTADSPQPLPTPPYTIPEIDMALAHLADQDSIALADLMVVLRAMLTRIRIAEECVRAMECIELAQDDRIAQLEAQLQAATPRDRLAAQAALSRRSSNG